jgi:hypothetical protein
MKYVLTVAILLLASTPTKAQKLSPTTGNELLEWCQSGDTWQTGRCYGYVIGVADLQTMVGKALPENRQSCIAEGMTVGQIVEVAIKYLKQHPEERHFNASVLMVKAIAEAFPCQQK